MAKLEKNFGFMTALTTVVGMVIGSGVFFRPNVVFKATEAPGIGMVLWIVAGIISIAGGLTAAELGAAIPKTGGMIAWLEEAFGKRIAFLLGWTQAAIFMPGTLAALAIIFATQSASLMGLGQGAIVPMAIGCIVLLAAMNAISSKLGGGIQVVSTAGKLIPLFAIIIFGFMRPEGGAANLSPMFPEALSEGKTMFAAVGAALVSIMFAFDGWINAGVLAGEMKNPAKDLPRAIVGGLAGITVIYVLINIAYLYVIPADVLANSATPAADVAMALFGPIGGKFITAGIAVSIFGACNGYMLTGMRVPYTLASEGLLPGSDKLGKIHPKFGTPVASCALISVLAILYTLSGQFNLLADLTIFVIWVFYTLTFIAVIKLRKDQPNLHRPYKVPLFPIVPIIAIVGGAYIGVSTFINTPVYAIAASLAALAGLPIYAMQSKKKAATA